MTETPPSITSGIAGPTCRDKPLSASETTKPRYVVGVDLGTTNSAVNYIDTEKRPDRIEVLPIPQVVAPGQVEPLPTLPSFHYEPAAGELTAESLRLPWPTDEAGWAVGTFARDHGALVPSRLIASAKSWLCHSGVDRTAELLPWQAAPDVERLSPVEASSRYLLHIRNAWDAAHPKHPLAAQDIALTLPASFDEVARELTVKAAARAGLKRVVLIEEPQAAFYAWIDAHAGDWERLVTPGQKILVCDIGGGTSDFTLIRVRGGEGGKIQFHRVAVGEHLVLGGDNLDLALAHHLEQRLTEGQSKLQGRVWASLIRRCQTVKEQLLGDDAPESLTVNLPSTGTRLIGGGRQIELSQAEVREVLLDGFFPKVDFNDAPRSRASGFQEFGLPYAPDPAMTKYLAAFLRAHREVGLDEPEKAAYAEAGIDPARPDIVLFNGGLFNSSAIRQRVLEVIRDWFAADDAGWQPLVLDNERLDLAVARGAAYYGMVRRGTGTRIAAGLARTYYLGVEDQQSRAVCVAPAGIEPGDEAHVKDLELQLLVSRPVEFPPYVSSTRLTDRPGELVQVDREQMTSLPPIRTVLHTRRRSEGETVPVELHARLGEIGTLELWCSEVDGRRSWRLQFDVRSATQTDVEARRTTGESEGFVDEETWQECRRLIEKTFGPEGKDKPEGLVKRLARAIGSSRNRWPATLLRRFWELLADLEAGRRRSAKHEARWLNLAGFSLRPGYGLAVDDWRVDETWRLVQGKLIHPSSACRTEGWILWRRIGGGLAAGQQQALAEPLLAPVRGLHRQATTGKGRGVDINLSAQDAAEAWRLLGSLELLSTSLKIDLGVIIGDLFSRRKMEAVRPAMVWALGRIGARQPSYGPLNTVVPAEVAAKWLDALIDSRATEPAHLLSVMQIARRTDDRYRDLPEKHRARAGQWLKDHEAPEHFVELVTEGGALDRQEQGLVFGESLPRGLMVKGEG